MFAERPFEGVSGRRELGDPEAREAPGSFTDASGFLADLLFRLYRQPPGMRQESKVRV